MAAFRDEAAAAATGEASQTDAAPKAAAVYRMIVLSQNNFFVTLLFLVYPLDFKQIDFVM